MNFCMRLSFVVIVSLYSLVQAGPGQNQQIGESQREVSFTSAIYLNGYDSYWFDYLGMTIESNYLYAPGEGGMDIFDLTIPDSPKFCSHLDFRGNSWGVAISGHYAYVATESAGLQIVNIDDPYSPYWVSTRSTNGVAYRVRIVDSLAYIANGTAGLAVMSLADSVAPVVIGAYNTPGNTVDVWVRDTVAFLADGTGGVQILSIANPTAPVYISSFLADTVSRISIQSNYLHALGRNLSIIDISTLQSPQLLGQVSAGGYSRDLEVKSSYAYVGGWFVGFKVYDVSSPTTPVLVSDPFHWPNYPITIDGNTAWLGQLDPSILQVDISNPANPVILSETPSAVWARGVSVGYSMYVALGATGVRTFQLNRSYRYVSPSYWQTLNTPGNALAVVEYGSGKLIIADSSAGLQVGTTASILGHCATRGPAIDVVINDHYAYVAEDDSGIEIIDLNNTSSPTVISHISTQAAAVSLCTSDGLVYVAERDSGMEVFDFSTPSAPVMRGRLPAWGRTNDLSSSPNFLAIADDSGLVIVNVTNPDAPSIFARVSLAEPAKHISTSPDTLVISTDHRIYFFDVRLPGHPVQIGVLTYSDTGMMPVGFSEGRAFVAGGAGVDVWYPSCCTHSIGNIDCDPDDGVDISDLTALVDYLYVSFQPLCCYDASNYDGDPSMGVDISDLSALVNDLYINPSVNYLTCEALFSPYLKSHRRYPPDSISLLTSPAAE